MHIGLQVMIAGLTSIILGVAILAGIQFAMIVGGFVAFLGGMIWLICDQ